VDSQESSKMNFEEKMKKKIKVPLKEQKEQNWCLKDLT